MADTKLSDMDALSSVADADLFYAVSGGVQKKVAASTIKTYMGTGEGGGGYSELRWAVPSAETLFGPDAVTTHSCWFELPLDYKAGTDIELHIHFTWDDNASGDVIWIGTMQAANINAVLDVVSPTSFEVTSASPETENEHQRKIIGSFSGTGLDTSAFISVGVNRMGTDEDDTYTSNVFLFFVDLKYETEAA